MVHVPAVHSWNNLNCHFDRRWHLIGRTAQRVKTDRCQIVNQWSSSEQILQEKCQKQIWRKTFWGQPFSSPLSHCRYLLFYHIHTLLDMNHKERDSPKQHLVSHRLWHIIIIIFNNSAVNSLVGKRRNDSRKSSFRFSEKGATMVWRNRREPRNN